MKKIKLEIDRVVKNYYINKKYLRQLIREEYSDNPKSRIDYYVTHPKYLYPLENRVRKALYEKYGIPHLIFDDLMKYMSDDVVKEGYLYE